MLIDFENPVLPVDAYSQRAFVEILNLILLAENVNELSWRLRFRDRDTEYRSLSGYFKWSFENYSFTLWQRIGYNNKECFPNKVLEIKHITLVCQDRWKHEKIKH